MKRKIFSGLIFLLLISSIIFNYLFYNDKSFYKDRLNKQSILISKSIRNDSSFNAKNKIYAEIISKYFDDEQFISGKKTITADQLIKMYNSSNNKNDSLKAELDIYKKRYESIQDSLFRLRIKYNYAQKLYKFKVYSYDRGNTIYTDNKFVGVDSAMILYPYLKDRMEKNNKGAWDIDLSGGASYTKRLNRLIIDLKEENRKGDSVIKAYKLNH